MTRHRIKPGKNGGKYRPGNVILLCANCHGEAERDLISPLILFQIVFNRIRKEMKEENKSDKIRENNGSA